MAIIGFIILAIIGLAIIGLAIIGLAIAELAIAGLAIAGIAMDDGSVGIEGGIGMAWFGIMAAMFACCPGAMPWLPVIAFMGIMGEPIIPMPMPLPQAPFA